MNRLREFIGSSSGLAPLRQGLGLGWIISVLAGIAVLIGAEEARADVCQYRTYIDCESDPMWCYLVRTNRDCRVFRLARWPAELTTTELTTAVMTMVDAWPTQPRVAGPPQCPSVYAIQCFDCSLDPENPICAGADPADPAEKYRYCSSNLDALCASYIGDCWYSSTPCTAECGYFDGCEQTNSTKPYRYCTTYHFDNDAVEVLSRRCICSSTPCSEATPTAVLTPAATGQPAQHRLGDSYPNPFNPAVVIPLDLATDAAGVSLMVYDVLGRRVRQVWDGPLEAGSHRFVWDGRDAAGRDVAAGVYIYKVETDGWVEAKKTIKLP